MKKNVGLLIHSLSGGGAERVVSRLSGILGEEYRVFVILFEDTYLEYPVKGTLISLDIPAVNDNFLRKALLPFRRARKLKKVKKENRLDAVISFMDSPNMVNLLSRNRNCKTVVSVRNYTENKNCPLWLEQLWSLARRFLYNRADAVIPVSRQIAENLISLYGIRREKVFTIYNPYDLEELREKAQVPVEPEFSKFAAAGKTFVGVGRMTYQKGFWHLVKAFKLVHDQHEDARLLIMGKDEYQGRLGRLVEDLGLGDCVWLMGFQENPFRYLARCNVFVLSSQHEGFPNAMVEAMACGCAVAAADCRSGPREILYERPELQKECGDTELAEFGILTPRLDPELNWDAGILHDTERKLAEAMLRYAEDETLLRDYSRKAVQRAQTFSYERCRKEYEKVIGP